ncbi:MAG: bacteriohemerythrin [Smithellaceae bacterium]
MKYFELTEEMLTGVESMDEQHRTIIELWNNFIDPYTIKISTPLFQDALIFLVDYIIYHLTSEEYAMMMAKYPYYENHCRWHELFTKQITYYIKMVQRKEMSGDLTLEVSSTLEKWLHEHVCKADHDFAEFLSLKANTMSIRYPYALGMDATGIYSKGMENQPLQKRFA